MLSCSFSLLYRFWPAGANKTAPGSRYVAACNTTCRPVSPGISQTASEYPFAANHARFVFFCPAAVLRCPGATATVTGPGALPCNAAAMACRYSLASHSWRNAGWYGPATSAARRLASSCKPTRMTRMPCRSARSMTGAVASTACSSVSGVYCSCAAQRASSVSRSTSTG